MNCVNEGERWSVSGVGSAQRLESWSEILAATHVAFEVRRTWRTPSRFQGVVTRRRLDGLMLVDCAATPFVGHRNTGLRDGLQPTEVEIIEPFFKRTLIFPRERVLAMCPRLGELDAFPPLDRNGPARLLVRYVNGLAAELARLDAAARRAAATAALELLRGVIDPSLPPSRQAAREAMRAEVRRYVRSHLQDPRLGPATIARAHSMSVRALHALFEDCEESVAGLVRRERLSRCLEDLQRGDCGSVTEIAFRWGFTDAAHFSRAFKHAFGVTPSEVRRAALRSPLS